MHRAGVGAIAGVRVAADVVQSGNLTRAVVLMVPPGAQERKLGLRASGHPAPRDPLSEFTFRSAARYYGTPTQS